MTLIVINQTTNKAFLEWVRALSHEVGMVELWTGNPPDDMGNRVRVRTGPSYNRASLLSRLWSWGQFMITVSWWLLTRSGLPSRTPIFVVTNPPFLPLLAWLLHRIQKRPYALLEWDIYPHLLSAMGLVRERGLIFRIWEEWHRRALQDAGMVITIGERMASTLRDSARDETVPLQIIPNWTDTEWIRPMPRPQNPFAQEHKLGDQLVVMYAGNLGTTHAIETLVEVADILQDQDGIRFLIIGEGTKRQFVEEAIGTKLLSNTQLLPLQPLKRVPYSLASADIGIVTLAEGYERLSMPSKTYNLLAAGNALLGISQSPNDLADTINRHSCGANFAPTDVRGIAEWLRSLSQDRANLGRYQVAARKAAELHYSRERCEVTMTRTLLSWLNEQ